MSIGGSYSYFFNYVAEQYEDFKMLKCFELQMPVKEVVFTSVDRKCSPIGEVEKFVLNAVLRLKRVSSAELNQIFHLGVTHIDQILQDFLELKVLHKSGECYSVTDRGTNLLDCDHEEETVCSEHSILYDIFPLKERVLLKPVKRDRYKRSLHNYRYPTEFKHNRPQYDPICLSTTTVHKKDITKLISLADKDKEDIYFSQDILEVQEIKRAYSFSHPLTFILLIDKKGVESTRVFDACNIATLTEIEDGETVLQNVDYLKHVFGEFFAENSQDLILAAFNNSKKHDYQITAKHIISVKPAVVRVAGQEWKRRAVTGFWYDYLSKLIVYLYPYDSSMAHGILTYNILSHCERLNNRGGLEAAEIDALVEKLTTSYNKSLAEFGNLSTEAPTRQDLFRAAIDPDYGFPKLGTDLQDIFEM